MPATSTILIEDGFLTDYYAGERGEHMTGETMLVEEAGLWKILDVLRENEMFHRRRDEIESVIHRDGELLFRPLTSETILAREWVEHWLRRDAAEST